MWRIRSAIRSFRLLAVAAVGVTLAGCAASPFGSGDAGPVHAWQVHGTPYASAGTLGVYPHQVVAFAAYLVNDARTPVVVTRASLIGFPGHREGRLVRVAVQTGKNRLFIDRNWPPEGVSIEPLIGRRLPRGRVYLAAGFTAPAPGVYATVGLNVTYRTGGHIYRTQAWGGAVGCIAAGHPTTPPSCRGQIHLENSLMDYIHRQ